MASTNITPGLIEPDPSRIPLPPAPTEAPTEIDLQELQWWRDQRHREQRWLHYARVCFAPTIFLVVCAWLVAVLAILLFDGFGVAARWLGGTRAFQLPDGILYTLLGATTAGVLGLFAVVAKFLFPGEVSKK